MRFAIIGLTLLAFTACTAMQPIRDFTPSRIRQQVAVGDHVEIYATDDGTYDLSITKVEADALYGSAPSGKRYKVPFESIRSISVERTSTGQLATGMGAVVTVAVIAFIYALLEGLRWESGGGEGSGSGSHD